MADTDSKYKDSFITQEELDRLLKDADALGPEAFAGAESGTDSPVDGDEDVVISQDDIDALLSLADGEPPAADDGADLISQDDIDALIAGNKRTPPPPSDDEFEDDGADLDLVTAEDIEKLLRSESVDTPSTATGASRPDTGSLDTITQEDLMGLTGGQEIKAEAALSDDGDDDSLISQDDIDALLAGARPATETTPEVKETPRPAETEDEEDSLISQEDIDSLLAGAGMPDTDAEKPEAREEEVNLISQEDIDKLLLGKSEEVEAEETLIDQEDIDRLLSSAQPFGEVTPGEPAVHEKLISQEDIDRLLNEDLADSEKEEERILDQVILETAPEKAAPKPVRNNDVWYRSRLFVSLAAVGAVLLVSLISLMLFSGKPETPLVQTDTITAPEPEIAPDVAEPQVYEPQTPQSLDIIMVTMNDFLVPAPAHIKGLAYIALNLTLEISDAPSDPIKDYEPFFRNIVYEVINKAFALQSESKIVEADLKKMIRDALNDALSEGSVSRIDFSDFKVG